MCSAGEEGRALSLLFLSVGSRKAFTVFAALHHCTTLLEYVIHMCILHICICTREAIRAWPTQAQGGPQGPRGPTGAQPTKAQGPRWAHKGPGEPSPAMWAQKCPAPKGPGGPTGGGGSQGPRPPRAMPTRAQPTRAQGSPQVPREVHKGLPHKCPGGATN